MRNLAGEHECDTVIRNELTRAGITIQEIPRGHTEVPYSVMGILAHIKFTRAWTYWCVKGDIPLKLAQEIYDHPEGRASVRTVGYAGNTPPEKWISYKDKETGRELLKQSEFDNASPTFQKAVSLEKYKIVEDITTGVPMIDSYHIDDQSGLLYFVTVVKNWLGHICLGDSIYTEYKPPLKDLSGNS